MGIIDKFIWEYEYNQFRYYLFKRCMILVKQVVNNIQIFLLLLKEIYLHLVVRNSLY